jgi:HEPN domain-containing protein
MRDPQIEGDRWFRQAKDDLEAARTLAGGKHHAAACFYSQQASEKALKAVLFASGERTVLGHAVTELLRRCADRDPRFSGLAESAALLDQFYIPTRYPNGLPSPAIPATAYTAAQSEAALKAAGAILDIVATVI